GKRALPYVAAVLPAEGQVVSPREPRAMKTAARGVLPFGFGRQPGARPLAVRRRVVPRNVNDRMVLPVPDGRPHSLRGAPARAWDGTPPRRLERHLVDCR